MGTNKRTSGIEKVLKRTKISLLKHGWICQERLSEDNQGKKSSKNKNEENKNK